ncbi:MAG: DMT family transporter [Candidatus Zixiibacteriota bacterium]
MAYAGELFALGTAFLWAFGSILFSYAGRRVGAFTVNAIRIPIAATFLTLLSLLIQREVFSPAIAGQQYGWLTFSAFLGLIIGDGCHFRAMVILGPRVASLLAASTPIFAVVFSWLALDQSLGPIHLGGIAVTLAGLVWVSLERNAKTFGAEEGGSKVRGYMYAGIGAVGQATGLIAAKIGMQENLSPLSASMIRMMAATMMIWLVVAGRGKIKKTVGDLSDRKARVAMLAAAVIGPVFGIWMSLLSIKLTKVGIASTLMSTTPLWIIPLVMIIHGERPSARAIIGTIITVGGVALLFLPSD